MKKRIFTVSNCAEFIGYGDSQVLIHRRQIHRPIYGNSKQGICHWISCKRDEEMVCCWAIYNVILVLTVAIMKVNNSVKNVIFTESELFQKLSPS